MTAALAVTFPPIALTDSVRMPFNASFMDLDKTSFDPLLKVESVALNSTMLVLSTITSAIIQKV
jgi:hypothetical protein